MTHRGTNNSSRRARALGGVVALAVLAASIGTAIAAEPPASPTEVVVVRLVAGATIQQVAHDHDLVVAETVLEHRNVHVLTTPDAHEAEKALKKDERVLWVDDEIGESTEDDRFHVWPSSNLSGADASGIADFRASLQLDDVHAVTTGAGVTIAVIDTGIDASHPLFEGRVEHGWDLVDDDPQADDIGNGVDDDGDGRVDETVGHGTHVAGVVHIMAPDARILSFRAVDSDGVGDVLIIAEAINMAIDAGADVINLSLGREAKASSKVLKDALARAKKSGVLIVAAAGNAASEQHRYPAARSGVLSVAALDGDAGEVATFASRGKWVDVAAPGVDITSAVPGGGYGRWSGSSMAAPVVAGQAALLAQLEPDPKPSQLRKWVRDTADKIDGPKIDKGRVNLLESLTKAL